MLDAECCACVIVRYRISALQVRNRNCELDRFDVTVFDLVLHLLNGSSQSLFRRGRIARASIPNVSRLCLVIPRQVREE